MMMNTLVEHCVQANVTKHIQFIYVHFAHANFLCMHILYFIYFLAAERAGAKNFIIMWENGKTYLARRKNLNTDDSLNKLFVCWHGIYKKITRTFMIYEMQLRKFKRLAKF
jgi:hypothetical protein